MIYAKHIGHPHRGRVELIADAHPSLYWFPDDEHGGSHIATMPPWSADDPERALDRGVKAITGRIDVDDWAYPPDEHNRCGLVVAVDREKDEYTLELEGVPGGQVVATRHQLTLSTTRTPGTR